MSIIIFSVLQQMSRLKMYLSHKSSTAGNLGAAFVDYWTVYQIFQLIGFLFSSLSINVLFNFIWYTKPAVSFKVHIKCIIIFKSTHQSDL